ncbi:MAG TPA: diguanylate cyclase [Gammaproteobacteria bacterium]|nr:diguanylate cyclase [Gammaproteobacteria bacterium]
MSRAETSTESLLFEERASRIVVLLVDDQAMVAEGIRRMLVDEDMDFHYCSDPKAAIQTAADIGATTILQDLVMPGVDGMTLVRFYRNHPATRNIPVIVLSTREDPKIKSDAFNNGATDYLVKLPDKVELIARIQAHSRSFMAQMERDAAFAELHNMQKQLEEANAQLQLQNEELDRLSSQDGLTGIANRRHFDQVLEAEWRRADREQTMLSLIMTDIDFFKLFNDNYGHQGGDDCLKQVSAALQKTICRPGDLVARYGGEEFVLILPNTPVESAMIIAEKLCASVRELKIKHELSKVSDVVTFSMGVATMIPAPGMVSGLLISAADQALYEAKEEGRNRVCRAPAPR